MKNYRITHMETRTVFVDVPAESWTDAFESFELWSDDPEVAASLSKACRDSDLVETRFVSLTSWIPEESDAGGTSPHIVSQ